MGGEGESITGPRYHRYEGICEAPLNHKGEAMKKRIKNLIALCNKVKDGTIKYKDKGRSKKPAMTKLHGRVFKVKR